MAASRIKKTKDIHCCCNLRKAGGIIGIVQLTLLVSLMVLQCVNTRKYKPIMQMNEQETARLTMFTNSMAKTFYGLGVLAVSLLFFGLYLMRHHLILPILFFNTIWLGYSSMIQLPFLVYSRQTYLVPSVVFEATILAYFLYIFFRCYQYVRDRRLAERVILIELKEITSRPLVATFTTATGDNTVVAAPLTDNKFGDVEKGLLPPSYEQCVNNS